SKRAELAVSVSSTGPLPPLEERKLPWRIFGCCGNKLRLRLDSGLMLALSNLINAEQLQSQAAINTH
ncbi:Hypothetical predicted protein, partial [Pelobates cultripes]